MKQKTANIISTLQVESNFEVSPIMYQKQPVTRETGKSSATHTHSPLFFVVLNYDRAIIILGLDFDDLLPLPLFPVGCL